MAAKNPVTNLNVGIIGFGFIGKLHANAYHNIPYCFKEPKVQAHIQAVLRNNLEQDYELIESLGIEKVTADVEAFYKMPLDIIDICTPNRFHRDMAIEALNRNKHVYCEKPLSNNLSEARAMAAAARKSDRFTHTALMLRYIPSVRQMKALIEADSIGKPYHFRAHLYHSSYLDEKRPMTWRLRKADSGGGALNDLGIHLLDLVFFLLGKADWMQCLTRTFIQERPIKFGSQSLEMVDVDDWAVCTLGMQCGATGTIEVTRVAGGINEKIGMEIIGSLGTLKVDFEDPMTCHYFDARRSQWLSGPQVFTPLIGINPIEELWPPSKQSLGFMLNAHLASAYDFLRCIQESKPSMVNFEAAIAAQELLEAAYLSADKNGQRITLPLD